jgi:hypothetical protein
LITHDEKFLFFTSYCNEASFNEFWVGLYNKVLPVFLSCHECLLLFVVAELQKTVVKVLNEALP